MFFQQFFIAELFLAWLYSPNQFLTQLQGKAEARASGSAAHTDIATKKNTQTTNMSHVFVWIISCTFVTLMAKYCNFATNRTDTQSSSSIKSQSEEPDGREGRNLLF